MITSGSAFRRRPVGSASRQPRVLVVDDDRDIRQVVCAYLERDGFEVMASGDGEVALRLARTEAPDAIALDLMLPGVGGTDVCRGVRKVSRVPIVILTVRDDITDKILGLEIGTDDYVTKPFDTRELMRWADRVCTREHLSEALATAEHSLLPRSIDSHVHNLRARLEPQRVRPQYVLTVAGVGYRFRPDRDP